MKQISINVIRLVMSVFFDARYLKGRWFENTFMGVKWCLRSILWQRIIGINRSCRFPVSPFSKVSINGNIIFDPDDLDNFQGRGNYYQCEHATIYIGKGSYIAQNVGIITANHDFENLEMHSEGKDVHIGEKCWIGMNSVILPGVVLGDSIIVGAGSVVTKSFPEGHCVIVGNPAHKIKDL